MSESEKFAMEVAKAYFMEGMDAFINGDKLDINGAESLRAGYMYAQKLLSKLRK